MTKEKKTDKTPLISAGRRQITDEEIARAVALISKALSRRLQEKGRGTFASRHEILGMITEEQLELTASVQRSHIEHVNDELIDIAVGSIFAVACILANAVDW